MTGTARLIAVIISGIAAVLIAVDMYLVDDNSTQPPATPSIQSTPVVTRWLNQTCPTVGALARTPSGGTIVCKAVGSEIVPKWHSVG